MAKHPLTMASLSTRLSLSESGWVVVYFLLRKHSLSIMAKTTVCRRWLNVSKSRNEGLDSWGGGWGGGGAWERQSVIWILTSSHSYRGSPQRKGTRERQLTPSVTLLPSATFMVKHRYRDQRGTASIARCNVSHFAPPPPPPNCKWQSRMTVLQQVCRSRIKSESICLLAEPHERLGKHISFLDRRWSRVNQKGWQAEF